MSLPAKIVSMYRMRVSQTLSYLNVELTELTELWSTVKLVAYGVRCKHKEVYMTRAGLTTVAHWL